MTHHLLATHGARRRKLRMTSLSGLRFVSILRISTELMLFRSLCVHLLQHGRITLDEHFLGPRHLDTLDARLLTWLARQLIDCLRLHNR